MRGNYAKLKDYTLGPLVVRATEEQAAAFNRIQLKFTEARKKFFDLYGWDATVLSGFRVDKTCLQKSDLELFTEVGAAIRAATEGYSGMAPSENLLRTLRFHPIDTEVR